MGQHYDAYQRMGADDALGAFMVIQRAVGQERIELPAFDQPGTGFGMRDLQGALLDGAQAGIVGGHEAGRILARRCRQQGQASDVVQQAGKIGFFRMQITHVGCDVARHHGRRQ